jgi:hypothetical protein
MDEVDSVLLSLVREFVRPGAVVWDVGANVGLFSFAEEAEMEVLRGAKRLFATVRPIVFCEVIPSSEAMVTRFLESHDYRIFDGETPAAQRQPLGTAAWSTLAIPMEIGPSSTFVSPVAK